MNRAERNMQEPTPTANDRLLWQRSRVAEVPEDEEARFLDLAAFADGLLDAEERDRVAALLAEDPNAAADVAAAQAPVAGAGESPVQLDRIIARACALFPDRNPRPGRVIAFAAPARQRVLHGFVQWGSLAAAIALAGWLGFTMGSGASLALGQPGQPSGDNLLNEVFDPATGFLSDLAEGSRT
jgi:anti-sigma factor RsiW